MWTFGRDYSPEVAKYYHDIILSQNFPFRKN